MKRVAILLLVFALTACASATPSAADIQAAIEKTQLAESPATQTPLPSPTETYTPTSTLTVTSTSTQTPTSTQTNTATSTNTTTPTQTITPSPTITDTPVPPQQATLNAVRTERAEKAIQAGITATEKAAQKMATKRAESALATKKADYPLINWRELVNYPDRYKGEKVGIRLFVFNIVSDYELQGYVSGTWEAIYVEFSERLEGVYEDIGIYVYGTVAGKKCFKNAYGAEICQPYITNAFYEKIK